jgi:hypothetical protein
MATNSQYLNGQFSDAQIEQLIQSLRGMKPIKNDIQEEEKGVTKISRCCKLSFSSKENGILQIRGIH